MTEHNSRKAASAGAQVTTLDREVDPVEEKVLRMKHGSSGRDDLPLGQVGQNHPETAKKLREMELRALEASGRLDELRRQASESDSGEEIKAKIVASLARKD